MLTGDMKSKKQNLKNNNHKNNMGSIISYEDQEFEMMSYPDGGKANKAALDSLSKANK